VTAIRASSLPASVRAKLPKTPKRGAPIRAVKELEKARAAFRRECFYAMLKQANLPEPIAEYRFDPKRMWRFDYCWPQQRVSLEVDGGAFSGGRHTTGAGFRRDLEKLNAATVAGWRVLRVLPEQLTTRSTETALRRLLTAR